MNRACFPENTNLYEIYDMRAPSDLIKSICLRMKNITKFFTFSVVILGFSASSFAQSATATATCTVLAAITITKIADMNFGNIVPGAAGTVVIAPEGTRSVGSGTPVLSGGTVSAAVFTVSGTGSSTYSISLPPNGYTITNGTQTMILNAFTSTPGGTGQLTGGNQTLSVGATLSVGLISSNPPGVYTGTEPFTITVAYN